MINPSEDEFEKDPFGYVALGCYKWAMAQNLAGTYVDLEKGPSGEGLAGSETHWTSALSQSAFSKPVFRHVRVHDLKRTFGRRVRAAGVSFEGPARAPKLPDHDALLASRVEQLDRGGGEGL